jgi:hypothetical protein
MNVVGTQLFYAWRTFERPQVMAALRLDTGGDRDTIASVQNPSKENYHG